MLLLPVAIMLAITGALAYTMTRQGAMSVSQVDRQYDLEQARYLAEAGLRLVKWRNEKESCYSSQGFTAVALPRVKGTVSITELVVNSSDMTMTATATGPLGAVSSARRVSLRMYERKATYPLLVAATEGQDTFIRSGSPKQGTAKLLEATDGSAHPLGRFGLAKLDDNARLAKATLVMVLASSISGQSERSVALHTLTREWKADDATWTFPWATPGGDYNPVAVASVKITGNGTYSWRIDSLARSWANASVVNYGLLLKPSGLNGAQFHSLEASPSLKPKLVIDYYKRCG
jgi:hypothetical protein